MPEYAVAVDIYGKWVHVQEYEAPKNVDQAKAEMRLKEIMTVILDTLQISPGHVFLKVRRRQKGKSQYPKFNDQHRFHQVKEGNCVFLVNFTDYLDTGLFLDHRLTRSMIQDMAKGKSFLNLFAYTGAATVHAAKGGAVSTLYFLGSCLQPGDCVESETMKAVLSIAGSDPSGGAGIQADLKTFCAFNVYGMAAITSLTAQNTVGVRDVFYVPSSFLAKQLEAICEDIRIDAVKIGMLGISDNIITVSRFIEEAKVPNVVLDPVLTSGSGRPLLEENAVQILKDTLFNLCTIVTPNLAEASILTGIKITDVNLMKDAAVSLVNETGIKNVLIKGGHLTGKAVDVFFDGIKFETYEAPKLQKPTHGTGCTLSSAIAAGLAMGFEINTSISKAKEYVLNAIKSDFEDIGKGIHPLNHFAPI